jgi:hypothetical protein
MMTAALLGLEDDPGLGLQVGACEVVDDRGGRVHLHRQVLAGVQVLDQQREPAAGRRGGAAEQLLAERGHQLRQGGPGHRPVRDPCHRVVDRRHGRVEVRDVPRLPHEHAVGQVAAEVGEVAGAPGLLDEPGGEGEGAEGHGPTLPGGAWTIRSTAVLLRA